MNKTLFVIAGLAVLYEIVRVARGGKFDWKKSLVTLLIAVAIAAGITWWMNRDDRGPVACTMEAKLCPDGSYVGRTGPNCEFSACPDE